MKVHFLLELLSRVNPDATVRLGSLQGDELIIVDQVGSGELVKDTPFPEPEDYAEQVVLLKGVSDVDLKREMETEAKIAIYKGTDELDYYGDILKAGITPQMVAEHCGEVEAWHMENFCREHGLIN